MIEIAVLAAHDELMRNAGNEVKDHLDLIELRIPFDIRPDQLHPVLPVPTRERLDVIGIGNVVAFAHGRKGLKSGKVVLLEDERNILMRLLEKRAASPSGMWPQRIEQNQL